MNNYDLRIHHRRTLRLKGYYYANEGLYFITICCHNRAHLFGQVVGGEMILNQYGMIAANEWLNTPIIRPNIELGEFVIMPNHIHGIIKITRRDESHSSKGVNDRLNPTESHSSKGVNDCLNPTESHLSKGVNDCLKRNESHLSTTDIKNSNPIKSHLPKIISSSTDLQKRHEVECYSPLRGTSNTVGAIVRGFKSSVTRQLNLLNIGCAVWQRNYYETIIKDQITFQRITQYIIDNPVKWQEV
ncbi:MAG: hypothetical protein IPL23_09465 [Saprospiraceae bacterium]|nr:hypothetical protein [Saprospiraceae bacterium]